MNGEAKEMEKLIYVNLGPLLHCLLFRSYVHANLWG